MKILIISLTQLVSLSMFAQQFDYLPSSPNNDQVLQYKEFSLSYNDDHLQPNWVAYELTAQELAVIRDRKDYFKIDYNVGGKYATLNDYKYSGYDRGHLSRAMFCKLTLQAYKESFLLSNISPQIGIRFNRTGGIWYNLEELEIAFAQQYGKIYSVSGPVFKNNKGHIGSNKVTVPGFFYKAILVPDYTTAVGFLIRHELTSKEPVSFAITIDSLEAFTGIDFYPSLPDPIEKQIESAVTVSSWPQAKTIHYTSSSIEYLLCMNGDEE